MCKVLEKVKSSDIVFERRVVGIDTVFTRFNEKKWIDSDGKHVGWIYDEVWEDKDEFIRRVSEENDLLSKENKILANKTDSLKQGLFELTMLTLGGDD